MVKQWLSVEKKVMVPFLSHKVLSMWHCSQKQSGCAAVMFGNVLKSVFVFWYSIEKVKCGYIKSLCVYSQKGKPDGILKTVIWEYGKNSCSPLSLIGWLVGWCLTAAPADFELTVVICLCLPTLSVICELLFHFLIQSQTMAQAHRELQHLTSAFPSLQI